MARPSTCPRCHGELSASPATCPHCGRSLVEENPVPARGTPGVPAFSAYVDGTPPTRDHPPGGATAGDSNPWRSLAAGSRWVCIGLAIESVALGVIPLLLVAGTHMPPISRGDGWRPAELIPDLLLVVVLGSGFVAWGRTAQSFVPRGLGVRGPLRGAAVLGWLQVLTAFVGVRLSCATVLGERILFSRSDPEFVLAVLGAVVALRWLAEGSAVTALGLVSGAMPSGRLRTRVSKSTVEWQVLGAGVAIVVLLAVVLPRGVRVMDGGTVMTTAAIVVTGIGLLLVSNLASLSLHARARRAALEWNPRPTP